MFVEVIADITCPWCFIGLRRFLQAVKQRPRYTPSYVWRPFLLNPDLEEGVIDRNDYLNRVFGSESRVQQFQAAIDSAGASVDIAFDFDAIDFTPSSLPPHRFISYASATICPLVAAEKLYSSYFEKGRNISDHNVLVDIVDELALDSHEADDYLKSDRGRQAVLDESLKIHRLGVNGVPSFVFGKRNVISGAQEPQTLLNMLDFTAVSKKLEENNDERPQWA